MSDHSAATGSTPGTGSGVGPASGPGLRIATVRGVPVYVGRSWPILAIAVVALVGPNLASGHPELGAFAYVLAVAVALLFLVAVLVHEVAHALTARQFGLTVHRIVADLLGGHTAFDSQGMRPGSAVAVALAGPLSNGLLAGLALLVSGAFEPDSPARSVLVLVAVVNAALAAFNLLPGLPLDGGQLVESAVWKVTGDRSRGMIAAGWSGRVVTVLVVLWFVVRPIIRDGGVGTGLLIDVLWTVFIASFLWAGATAAIRGGTAIRLLGSVQVAQVLRPAHVVSLGATLGEALAEETTPVVVDEAGRPIGLVAFQDLEAVPDSEFDATPVQAVLRAQPASWVVETAPEDGLMEVVRALQGLSSGVVAVTRAGALLGLVTAADVNRALEPN